MLDSYKCSNCGGFMTFDASLGKLCCLSCKKEEAVENYQAEYEQYDCEEAKNYYLDGDARQYICRKCDSIIITDDRSAISECPFCGGQTALGERLSDEIAPTHIIPFKITKKEAEKAYKKWRRKLPFAPHDFPKNHEVREVTGIYYPAMCYDVRVQGETTINAKRSKKISTPEDEREGISCYHLYRKHDLLFHHMPVSSSGSITDSLSDQLCPYHFDRMTTFSPAHLKGCLAEKNAVSPAEVCAAAEKKAEKFTEEYMINSISGYEELAIDEKKYEIGMSSVKYILLPVWLVIYDYNNKEYVFAMNGETGKIACEPPKSWGKIGTGAALIALAIFLTLRIITMILGGPLL